MRVAAILAAGGLGTRAGGTVPKQFHDLGDGSRMITRALTTLLSCPLVDEVVVALPAGFSHGVDPPRSKTLTTVAAGARRQDSVANALARVSDAADIVVIHDAARPFVSSDLVERTIRAAEAFGAAIAALPVHDTVKQSVEPSGATRTIRVTLPRETIFLAQTPQAFRRELLEDAMAVAGELSVTDESMLVERAGHPVHLVEGDAANVKVTTADDLAWARARVRGDGGAPTMRVGTGYDLHRLVDGRPLILAGVPIPFEKGLLGHSDADIVCHAVTDAILGAASLGDIGRLFPDSSPEWKDADSVQLLRRAVATVHAAGFRLVNVDVTVIAERPKLLPHLEAMRETLAAALEVDSAAIGIKGKTNEGVDATGRGEAMACHAIALLARA
jgi:2-C-methyl-D-erythritol 4-phosphate cytidylyltransferase/2-C-methyl-D-erythritol 2,4-cyclodiphosphate synthase